MYIIRQTHQHYGRQDTRSLVVSEETGVAAKFATRREAQQHIGRLNAEPYHASHNESGRPEYKTLSINALPQYLKWGL